VRRLFLGEGRISVNWGSVTLCVILELHTHHVVVV